MNVVFYISGSRSHTNHPPGTWVLPKGSTVVAGNATNVGTETPTGTPEESKLPAEQNATGSAVNQSISKTSLSL